MLVVDASALFEVVTATPAAEAIRTRLAADPDHSAPHLIDAEVLGAIRHRHRLGRLDPTAAAQAVDDLANWPGERFGHRLHLGRAWELRSTVRHTDALYIALSEALAATLLTTDGRLGRAPGPRCPIEVLPTS